MAGDAAIQQGEPLQIPATEAPNVCVYTVLTGKYERLNEQTAAAHSRIPFVCFTDDPDLRSECWNIRVIPPLFPMDAVRSQRDLKIRPHLHLPEFDGSIYIDNSIILDLPPEKLWEQLDPSIGFMLPEHSFRDRVVDEFLEVVRLGFDDPARIFEQLNHYSLSHPQILLQRPWWDGLLVRSHNHPVVRRMQEIWAAHVFRYSRRDQLSINLAFHEAGLEPVRLQIDNHTSWFHHWPVTPGRDRDRTLQDMASHLVPMAARLRAMETASEAMKQAQRSAAETARQHAASLQEQLDASIAEAQRSVAENARLEAEAAAQHESVAAAIEDARFATAKVSQFQVQADSLHNQLEEARHEKSRETAENARLREELSMLQQLLHQAEEDAQRNAAENAARTIETATLRTELDERIEALSVQLATAVADADSCRQQAATLQAILSSTSWRLLEPFRKAADRYPRLARLSVRPLKVLWWTVTLQLGHRFVLWRRYHAGLR